MANFFISDLHIGHANVIRFDQRPFANLSEMHEAIVTSWNSVVTGNDTVYILGDFIWGKDSEWPFYVAPLAGNKVLIRGNHDIKGMSKETRKLFADFKDYMEISDGDRRLILSHYPIPFHHYDFLENCYMLYGHVHSTLEYQHLRKIRKQIKESWKEDGNPRGNFINVGCMMPWINYTPRTLDEIIAGDKQYECAETDSE